MEEIIYDIESGEGRVESGETIEGGSSDCRSEGLPGGSDAESASGTAVRMPAPHEEPDAADADSASGEAVRITDPHKEIERMVEEMGAETLLSILKDNRNAAIRQIISEIEAARQGFIPSGTSMARECSSIFDLAALA